MEQNKDQSRAAVRGEAVALNDAEMDAVMAEWACISNSLVRLCRMVEAAVLRRVSARAADAPSDLPTEILAKVMTCDDFNCSTELGYAQFLAWAIWLKSYRNVSPDFSIMDNLKGVLSQIDNMVCGLSRAADALDGQPTELDNLEDLIVQHRIAIAPEYEGGFHAHIYGDGELSFASGYGATPRDAIKDAFASSQPTDGGVRNG